MDDGPYRQAIEPPSRAVARPGRPRRPRRWYWALPAVAGVALLPLGGGAAMLGLFVLTYTALGSGLARRHARHLASESLQQLPFPVTHRPSAGADLDGAPRELVEVHVRLRATVAASTADRACTMALEMVPELQVSAEDAVVT